MRSLIAEISAASEEQAASAEEIGNNIDNINKVTQQSGLGTQQIAKSSEELNILTEALQNLLKKFKITINNQKNREDKYKTEYAQLS